MSYKKALKEDPCYGCCWDNGYLVVFIDGTEDNLSGILGDLKLGVGHRSPVVQNHYNML